MAKRVTQSLKLSLQGTELANQALMKYPSKTFFADKLQISRGTVHKFFACQPVKRENFFKICEELQLDWLEVADMPKNVKPELKDYKQHNQIDTDVLVKEVREKIKPFILKDCGTMKVLDMSQPIGLKDIYTNVNILEKISGRRGIEIPQLLQNFDPELENFDRCGLSPITEERVPGLKIVENPEVLQVDSEAVLKSIEAQHGLLVERARGIYSFSHLTFQEYFTASEIITICNPNSLDDKTLQNLAEHITKKRWREVFLLTIAMLPSADCLLILMKQQIDELVSKDHRLQEFLASVQQKSNSFDCMYKPVIVRFLYFKYRQEIEIKCQYVDYNINFLSSNIIVNFVEHIDPIFIFHLNNIDYLQSEIKIDVYLIHVLETAFNLVSGYCFELGFDSEYEAILEFKDKISLESLKKIGIDEKFAQGIENFNMLINQEITKRYFSESWEPKSCYPNVDYGQELRNLLIKYRKIGHDWQLSWKQEEILDQYFNANLFLVECMNSDCCYVSREVQREIEDTLFLPISEIEKRKSKE